MLTLFLIGVLIVLLTYVYLSRRAILLDLQNHGIFVPPTNVVFGNLLQTEFGGKAGHLVQEDWIKKYGKVFGKYNGLRKRVVIGDLDVIQQILVKDFQVFTNRPILGRTKMLVNLTNERWKGVRKILSPTFSSRKLKKMYEMMDDCVNLMNEVVEAKAQSGEGFDIYSNFQALTLDVIGRCALAMNIDCQTNKDNYMLRLAKQFFGGRIPPLMLLIICFPALEAIIFPLYQLFSRGPKIERIICENILKVMKTRRQNPEAYNTVTDVLQLLLQSQTDSSFTSVTDVQDGDPFKAGGDILNEASGKVDSEKDDVAKLTDEEIAVNAWMFLLAGYETTSTTLAFTMFHLAKHPEIQEEIRMEIRQVTGIDNLKEASKSITYGLLSKMEYLEKVMDESMRINPSVVMFVSRRSAQDYPIPGYQGMVVPKDAVVEVPVWQIHHDPELYPDPEKFDPERFTPEEKAKRHPMAFLPFGAGPRICIGLRFAVLEIKLCLAKLLAEYSFVPDPEKFKDPLPTELRFAIMYPSDGVWVQAKKLSSE